MNVAKIEDRIHFLNIFKNVRCQTFFNVCKQRDIFKTTV